MFMGIEKEQIREALIPGIEMSLNRRRKLSNKLFTTAENTSQQITDGSLIRTVSLKSVTTAPTYK